jgi:hypothetical protein
VTGIGQSKRTLSMIAAAGVSVLFGTSRSVRPPSGRPAESKNSSEDGATFSFPSYNFNTTLKKVLVCQKRIASTNFVQNQTAAEVKFLLYPVKTSTARISKFLIAIIAVKFDSY